MRSFGDDLVTALAVLLLCYMIMAGALNLPGGEVVRSIHDLLVHLFG